MKDLGVEKSKPKTIPRLFEKKIEETIARAKNNVEKTQASIEKSKAMAKITAETIQEVRRKRRA